MRCVWLWLASERPSRCVQHHCSRDDVGLGHSHLAARLRRRTRHTLRALVATTHCCTCQLIGRIACTPCADAAGGILLQMSRRSGQSVLCVGHTGEPAKTAEQIELPFPAGSIIKSPGPKEPCISLGNWDPGPPVGSGRGTIRGDIYPIPWA